MSDEIMFSDMLNHYSLKLSEIYDMLNNMTSYLNKSLSVAVDSWQSEAADKYIMQIDTMKSDLNEISLAMDNLLRLFNVVKNNELNNQISQLERSAGSAGNN